MGVSGGAGSGFGTYPYASLVRSVLSFVTAVTNTATAGSNIQMTQTAGGFAIAFISPPVAVAFTLAGTVTFNLWAKVNLLAANTTVAVSLIKYSSGAEGAAFLTSSFGTAVTTTIGAKNWTGSPTSTAFAVGDRLVIKCLITNATSLVMVTGDTLTMDYAGKTAAADGESFISLTESVSFQSEPEFIQECEGLTGVSMPGVTTAGNLLVFNLESSAPPTAPTISDVQGDAFVTKLSPTWNSGANLNAFGFAANIAGGAATFTMTNEGYGWIVEYGGMAPAPYDTGDLVGATGTGAAASSNSVNTNYSNELIVGMLDFSSGAAGGASVITRTAQGGAIEDMSVTAAGSYAGKGTQSAGPSWIATVLTFKWATQIVYVDKWFEPASTPREKLEIVDY